MLRAAPTPQDGRYLGRLWGPSQSDWPAGAPGQTRVASSTPSEHSIIPSIISIGGIFLCLDEALGPAV